MTLSQVSERLYIGNFFVASNLAMLQKEGITHVVVAAAGLPAKFPSHFSYLEVAMFDLVEYNILQHFATTNAFIAEAEEQGGKVFVHCAMGISRSASVVIAYLMQKHRWKLLKALKFLKSKHPEAQPNIGFMQQLKSYEEALLKRDDGGGLQCGSCALW